MFHGIIYIPKIDYHYFWPGLITLIKFKRKTNKQTKAFSFWYGIVQMASFYLFIYLLGYELLFLSGGE
jgi:hypothetical protein